MFMVSVLGAVVMRVLVQGELLGKVLVLRGWGMIGLRARRFLWGGVRCRLFEGK